MELGRILLVEDEDSLSRVLRKALEKQGYWVAASATGHEARRLMDESGFDAALVDIHLPDMEGLALLDAAREAGLQTPFIVMTAQNTMRNAIEAMKAGAFDYLTKPFDLDVLMVVLERALERRRLSRELSDLKEEVKKKYEPGVNMIGTSAAMQQVFKTIGQVAGTDTTILIQGESGTGKELVAKTIHYNSARWNKPFVPVNCAAIPRDLLESELFGHEKGAFTGALERRLGTFELAHEGTLFLDEIGELPLDLQTKLLRVLQDGSYRRVGGKEMLRSDARLLAATNRDLEKAVHEKRFRDDLYFRLKVIPIEIPPLRDRRSDLPALIDFFIAKVNNDMGTQVSGVSADALRELQQYDWPGNVRELENVLIRAAVLSPGPILSARDFALSNRQERSPDYDSLSLEEIIRGRLEDYFRRTRDAHVEKLHATIMGHVERPLIEMTLKAARGNQIRAAQMLGINRNTLRKKITDLGITVKREP
ncbi:MAG: sigma-54 dependent transcriptional regulator [Deltaproteobacteria bacterium]|nr:sigma-54 dependent transcriptional regulator [Deltaproteobacteria bacterium]